MIAGGGNGSCEINMAFNAGYIRGDDVPEPGECGYRR